MGLIDFFKGFSGGKKTGSDKNVADVHDGDTEREIPNEWLWHEWGDPSKWHKCSTREGTFGIRISLEGMSEEDITLLIKEMNEMGAEGEIRTASGNHDGIKQGEKTYRVLDDQKNSLNKLLKKFPVDDVRNAPWKNLSLWDEALIPGNKIGLAFSLKDLTVEQIVALKKEISDNQIKYGWGKVSYSDGSIKNGNLYLDGSAENLEKIKKICTFDSITDGKRGFSEVVDERLLRIVVHHANRKREEIEANKKPTIIIDLDKGVLSYDGEHYDLNNLPDGLIIDRDVCLIKDSLFKTKEDLAKMIGDKKRAVPDLSKLEIKGNCNIIGAKLESLDYLPKCDHLYCDVEQAKLISENGSDELKGKTVVFADSVHFLENGDAKISNMSLKLKHWEQLLSYVDVPKQVDIIREMEKSNLDSKRRQNYEQELRFCAMTPGEKKSYKKEFNERREAHIEAEEKTVMERVGTPPKGEKHEGNLSPVQMGHLFGNGKNTLG